MMIVEKAGDRGRLVQDERGAYIPFNRPYLTGQEIDYLLEAHSSGVLAGDGQFTKRCNAWLERSTGTAKALLTHSCTAALEMGALLFDIRPGDEIIMPSYTFVSTANAFALRGGVPVFVDVRPDTLNLDETLIEGAITSRTRAIVPVHYAGVGCEMDTIMAVASRHGLAVLEDAAQGTMATYNGRPLGSIGTLGALSFHETKNVISGEGGALLVNDPRLADRAEVIREKGTNRARFFRGEIDRYTWEDIGSSFLPGEIVAAFLWAQLQRAREITDLRLSLWARYHRAFAALEAQGIVRRPIIPSACEHNAHMYYILFAPNVDRETILKGLRERGVRSVFHYVPLHSSPAGQKFGRAHGPLPVTEDVAERLVRLPMWVGITPVDQDRVIREVISLITESYK